MYSHDPEQPCRFGQSKNWQIEKAAAGGDISLDAFESFDPGPPSPAAGNFVRCC